ncbi:DNA repair-scaffolding protein isoform X2 [Callorhinchus milii]|uniref:DNA repair-scaffolding protein isoform X2 n=1 Tax=Callorhinchus milii TaxID=7868 RepID=UPI001C3FD1CF|nr:DNA repair-scaffolding protein isoform X2 [Callorhinchus milii]
MAAARKRKRSEMVQGSNFPHDVEITCTRPRSLVKKSMPSIGKSWDRCGEGFQDSSQIEDDGPLGKKLQVVRSLTSALQSNEDICRGQESEEKDNIVWSSSDSELSDPEMLLGNSKERLMPKTQRTINSYHKYLHMINSLTDSQMSEDESPTIDWDSFSDNEEISDITQGAVDSYLTDSDSSTSSKLENRKSATHQPTKSLAAYDISEFSSDSESSKESKLHEKRISSTLQGQLNVFSCESDRDQTAVRSASDWLKTAQAFLQTPEKQERKQFKTPDDSAKKKRKFLRGGLAERLNRLQCRERSAIHFWRHQTTTDWRIPAAGKVGVLVLKILDLHEECSMLVTLCQPLIETSIDQTGEDEGTSTQAPLKVLFTRETASHLRIVSGDLVHVHSPWQKLVIQDQEGPVILCTYFSQKILSNKDPGTKDNYCCPGQTEMVRKAPISLAMRFNLTASKLKHDFDCDQDKARSAENPSATQQESLKKERGITHWSADNLVWDSLLEVIESQGTAGWTKQNVKVVIQRVYCLPVKDILHNQLTRKDQSDISLPSNVGQQNARLCLLVQDVYGLFSEVQLRTYSLLEEDLQQQSACWEGKRCYLKGMKIIQRTTRGRSSGLFSLIDSLWPPLIPPKVHGQSQGSQESVGSPSGALLPAPSFCYVLAARPGERGIELLQEENGSDLYRPTAWHNLEHILQYIPESHRCSFSAEVIYRRLQAQTANQQISGENWVFVTDSTLQSSTHDPLVPRSLPVCVTSFCVLCAEVTKELNDGSSHTLLFKDAIVEKDNIVCAEGTVLSLYNSVLDSSREQEFSQVTGPVTLDELSIATKMCSLCTVQGTVVGVDETTAFSWIVCNRCGSEKLEKKTGERKSLYCRQCVQPVTTPLTKMQLEVFLQYPALPQSTIKVKLLQPSISSLLRHSSDDEEGYEIECVLGKETGPLNCYVRSVTKQPSCWIGLEEISLQQASNQPLQ